MNMSNEELDKAVIKQMGMELKKIGLGDEQIKKLFEDVFNKAEEDEGQDEKNPVQILTEDESDNLEEAEAEGEEMNTCNVGEVVEGDLEETEAENQSDEEVEAAEVLANEDAREDSNVNFEQIMCVLDGLSGKVQEMNDLFVKKIQHTTHEEKILDQMHSELQKYKNDMYSQLVRPILLDIIDIRDSILRMSSAYADKPEAEQNIPLKTFRDYTYDIQDVLEKYDISVYDTLKDEAFIPLKHKVIKKVTTDVEDLHGRIAESFTSGYDYKGKTISPEKVAVYVYEKTTEVEGDK